MPTLVGPCGAGGTYTNWRASSPRSSSGVTVPLFGDKGCPKSLFVYSLDCATVGAGNNRRVISGRAFIVVSYEHDAGQGGIEIVR